MADESVCEVCKRPDCEGTHTPYELGAGPFMRDMLPVPEGSMAIYERALTGDKSE
jgi:hypothetical protein